MTFDQMDQLLVYNPDTKRWAQAHKPVGKSVIAKHGAKTYWRVVLPKTFKAVKAVKAVVTTVGQNFIAKLPGEMIETVMKHLDTKSLASFALVNKAYRVLSSTHLEHKIKLVSDLVMSIKNNPFFDRGSTNKCSLCITMEHKNYTIKWHRYYSMANTWEVYSSFVQKKTQWIRGDVDQRTIKDIASYMLAHTCNDEPTVSLETNDTGAEVVSQLRGKVVELVAVIR
jgi:hypothetical protein